MVTETIREKVSDLPGIATLSVKFCKLVDLAMPQIGDMSWYERDMRKYPAPDPEYEYLFLDNNESYRSSVGTFYELLGASLGDIKGTFTDWRTMTPNYGTYVAASGAFPVSISLDAMRHYPLIGNVYRQDLFEIIAPHLDLDYFAIAILYP